MVIGTETETLTDNKKNGGGYKNVEWYKKGKQPIYFFNGDEPYYIDIVSDFIEKKVLSEEEKGFNQTVLYGRDVSIEDISQPNAIRWRNVRWWL
jgi:hypothetical protein